MPFPADLISLGTILPMGQDALWSRDGASPLPTSVMEIQSVFVWLFFTRDIADFGVARVHLHCSKARGCVRQVVLLSPLYCKIFTRARAEVEQETCAVCPCGCTAAIQLWLGKPHSE